MAGAKKQLILNILFGILFTAIGIGLLVGGSFLKKDSDEKLKTREHTTGIVVGEYYPDHDGMYHEIVEFEVNGVKYTARSNSSSNVKPSVGKQREVAYNPFNPEDAIIVSDAKTGNTLMFIVGGIFTAVGPLILISMLITKLRGKNTVAEDFARGAQETGNDNPFSVPHNPNEEPPFHDFDSNERK